MNSSKNQKNNNLLVISHAYNNFQKSCIEGVAPRFREINVLVRTNPFAELSNFFPVPYLNNLKISYKIDLSSKPFNINVVPTPIWYLPWDRGYKALGDGHFAKIQKALLKNNLKFDLVHSQFTWSAGYVGARLKEKYDVPFVVTARGYDIYSLPFKDEEWRERIKYVLNSADYVTTVSQSNLDCIKKINISTPVAIVHNGFRTDQFYPSEMMRCRMSLNLPLDKKIILTVGNLEPIKGQKYLINAIKKILNERNDILCIIVGAGKLEHVLKQQIQLLGLNDTIIMAGGKPHSIIPQWMNACDLFVLPSLNEGNPNVMFEALGCGKPFIGTKVGGIPEIITSDNYGLLVEPEDPQDLAQKILSALDREWDSEIIVGYSRQFAREMMSKKIIEIYDKVLGGNRPS